MKNAFIYSLMFFSFLVASPFANAGCLRCEDGHVICHGTCEDQSESEAVSARRILGKQFCSVDSTTTDQGWGFSENGRAYNLMQNAGMPDPSKYMDVLFLDDKSLFQIWLHDQQSGKGHFVGEFSYSAQEDSISSGTLIYRHSACQ